MIRTKTVFVLGAGASCHLGFPTGNGLRTLILRSARKGTDRSLLSQFDSDLIDEFHEAFRASGQVSIDNFLQMRSEFAEFGKYAIALALIPFERREMLFSHTDTQTPKSNWYEYLFSCLRTATEKKFWEDNNVFFVTFNYDRSLEYYLASCLTNCFKIPLADTLQAMGQLIVHIHGNLGNLTKDNPELPYRDYEPILSADKIRWAAKGVRVVHEEDSTHALSVARHNLHDAARILFLGFGYDRMNLDKLGWTKLKDKGSSGTGVGLQQGERDAFAQEYGIHIPSHGDLDIEIFLRNQIPKSTTH